MTRQTQVADLTLLRAGEYREMPWKNGGGTTREIALFPPDASVAAGDFFWRLSSARIARPGPFSSFAGCDRWLVVVGGDGLSLNGRPLFPLTPLRFSGETAMHATFESGPIVDLGVIFRRDRVQAVMTVETAALGGGLTLRLGAGTHFLYCASGAGAVQGVRLNGGDTLRAAGFETLDLLAEPGQAATIVRVSVRVPGES